MEASQARIFVATPTANGIMLSGYVASTVRMITHLQSRGVATEFHTIDGSNLIMQRDMLAHAFLASDCTHLLFIDSDMAFEPGLAEKLMSFGKPIVGTICAKRALDLARVKALVPAHGFDHALALAYDWNMRLLGERLELRNGLCRVAGIGFGFALIERACVLEAANGAPQFADPRDNAPIRALFRETGAGDGAVLDLDYSFCKRWVDRGGEVWAYAGAQIRHIGDFAYGVPFAAYLAALQAGASKAAGQARADGGAG